jgi:hypothetical protein
VVYAFGVTEHGKVELTCFADPLTDQTILIPSKYQPSKAHHTCQEIFMLIIVPAFGRLF